MNEVLSVTLSTLMLLAGAALAEPPPAELAGTATVTVPDNLSPQAVADLTSVAGGERSHSCRANSVAGVMLTTAGQVLGFPTLTAIGTYLTIQSMTICI